MDPIHVGPDGLYSFHLQPAPLTILALLLDPEVPWVWVVGYTPVNALQWWSGLVQLAPACPPRRLEVRLQTFEFRVATAEFLSLLPEIPAGQGLALYQMRQRVPDTLWLQRIDQQSRLRVLAQNGLHAHYWDYQCGAEFAAPDRATLERALQHDAVRSLALFSSVDRAET